MRELDMDKEEKVEKVDEVDEETQETENSSRAPIIIIALLLLAAVGYYFYNQNQNSETKSMTDTPNLQTTDTTVTQATELVIEDLTSGTGAEAVIGKVVTVNYLGTLTNGTKFDSSYDRGTPFSFTLGDGDVIQGWDKGVVGMKVGGKRKLTIPSNLGYGDRDLGVIPPNSTLVFEVELLKVE